ncbi:MAG TPA: hypothetical protein VJ746_11785 [Nitrospira sp.]|nr:hypothetical protein [Nitrospira sp.]
MTHVTQADEGKDQLAGEVQERAVPPGIAPAVSAPLQARPLQPAIAAAPLSISALPGHFAIQTFGGNYLTAVGGGGRTTDVVHTDATSPGAWEQYRLFLVLGHVGLPQQYAIQTASFNYLTAVDGGGRSSEVLHTDAKQVQLWETFKFIPDQYGWRNAIQTVNGHYLTAVGAGGKTTDAIHSDAVQINTWEEFYIWKCGDLGSGYQYTISAVSHPYGFLFAYGGGGREVTRAGVFVSGALGVLSDYNLRPSPFDNNWQKFRLMRQSDGSYAILTPNGVNYITAIQGGGLASGTLTSDDLVTDRTQVQAWEKFNFVDQGDCSYAIQTVSGKYLGQSTAAPGTALGVFSTNVSDIRNATKFRLAVVF